MQQVIGDDVTVARFPSRDHFAAYNGTAPVEVSSGERKIYRLSLRGNRRQPRDPASSGTARAHPVHLPMNPAPGLRVIQQRRPQIGRDPAQLASIPHRTAAGHRRPGRQGENGHAAR